MKLNLKENLEKYNNNIEKALQTLLSVDEVEAKKISKNMSLDDYLQFTIAVEEDREQDAMKILNKYRVDDMPQATIESALLSIRLGINEDKDFLNLTDFILLDEFRKREVLNYLSVNECQKVLANLKGLAKPGFYESALFQVHLHEEIIKLAANEMIKIYINEMNKK